MDITISVLLLIWLTSKWLSSGLFILLSGHTRLIGPRDHVWRCQWSVVTQLTRDPGVHTGHIPPHLMRNDADINTTVLIVMYAASGDLRL